MDFELFEFMYQRLWQLIYDICAVLGVDLKNPYEAE